MNDEIPPGNRIRGRLTHWELDVKRLAHYAEQLNNPRLKKRIARLSIEIERSLAEARATLEMKG